MIRRKLPAALLIASVVLTSPGPGLYSAFAQGGSGKSDAGSRIGREMIRDGRLPELDPREDAPVGEDLALPEIELPSPEAILEPGAMQAPSAVRELLGESARRMAASPAEASSQAKTTYDGTLAIPRVEGADAVPMEPVAQEGAGLNAAAPREATAVPSVGRSPAHPHDDSGPGWKLWVWRGALVAAAAAAVATEKITVGIVPLALLSAGVVGSVVAHELGHLAALKALGDGTAKKLGHDSLNPFRHVDFWNTIVTPISTLTASLGFLPSPIVAGAAKPIPADFNRLHDDRRDPFWVSLAGPGVNLALAALSFGAAWALPSASFVLSQLAWTNVAFAAFNLLVPLPGFDGGKVWARFLPKKLYDAFTRNPRLPAGYQSIHRKIYTGPAYPLHLLSLVGIGTQPQVNRVVWGMNIAVAGAVYLGAFLWLGTPVVFLLLACAYDYYCIREKLQNEAAVKALIGILQDFTADLAQAAEEDDSIQSVINQEEIEHVMKNALEDVIDQVVDSQGFDALSADGKWDRFHAAYVDAAVKALREKGMTEDSPETIRRMLGSDYGQRFFTRLRAEFVDRYEVWAKWHSPKRKAKTRDSGQAEEKPKTTSAGGAGTLSVFALALLGASLLGLAYGDPLSAAAAIGAGAVFSSLQEVPKVKTFAESLDDGNLKLDTKEKAFLLLLLKEMKLESKPPVTGRVAETAKVYKNVTAPRGQINSVVLLGKKGVGKTAVPEKLAQLIALSETQGEDGTFRLTKMKGKFLVRLELGELLIQEDPAAALSVLIKLVQRFNESRKQSGNRVILFIDEIHSIFKHSKGPQMAELLKAPLRNGELSVIAATTEKEYKAYMEQDDAFRDRMLPIWLEEATVPETLRALQGAQAYYEDLFGAKIAPEALKAAAEDSEADQEVFLPRRAFRYLEAALKESDFESQRDRLSDAIGDKSGELLYVMRQLREDLSTTELATENLKKDKPGTVELYNWAIDLTREIVEFHRKRGAVPAKGAPVVTAAMVREQISEQTGVDSGQLTLGKEPMEKYLEMEDRLNEIIIGQREAIHVVSESVKAYKAGVVLNPEEPIGTFYMTGPTGSGKSYFVKELAKYLSMNLVRLDMSEYMHDHEVSKMQGAPPGYVGFEAGGQLTEQVRRKPNSVILWDEIEKAHPAVFLMMLQILGEGRLTDGQGRTVKFNKTLNIMTSNLGMGRVNELLGKYVARYKELKAVLAAAGEDAEKRASGEAAIIALSESMAAEMKEPTQRITDEEFRKFPPEFQGRFTAQPIVFNRVNHAMALKIVDLELRKLRKVLERAGNALEWTPKAVKNLTIEGFDIERGARPLNNTIKRMVIQPIANEILKTAVKNKDRGGANLIKVDGAANGGLRIDVLELPPKKAAKRDAGAGAQQELFSKVLGSVVGAVANRASPSLGIGEIDGWVRQAIAAYPEKGRAATRPQAPVEPERPRSIDAAPAAHPPAAASALLREDVRLELGAGAQKFAAETYRPKKDAGVRRAEKLLGEALEARGYSPEVKEALLRAVANAELPFVGALKLFVEQAKLMGKDDQSKPVGLAFEVGEERARLLIHHNGGVGETEAAMWRSHFTGSAPDPAAARERAELLNVMGKDGRRLYFDLYRALSAIPGARIGWATGANALGGAGTDYWVELPKAVPPPPPLATPAPEEPQLRLPVARPKLSADHALPERSLRLDVQGLGLKAINDILRRHGLETIDIAWAHLRFTFVDSAAAAAKAAALAAEPLAKGVEVSSDVWRLFYPEPATQRATAASDKISLDPELPARTLRVNVQSLSLDGINTILRRHGMDAVEAAWANLTFSFADAASAAAKASELAIEPGIGGVQTGQDVWDSLRPAAAQASVPASASGPFGASDPRLAKIEAFPHGKGPVNPQWFELEVPTETADAVRTLLERLDLEWRGNVVDLASPGKSKISVAAGSLRGAVDAALLLANAEDVRRVRLHAVAHGFLMTRSIAQDDPRLAKISIPSDPDRLGPSELEFVVPAGTDISQDELDGDILPTLGWLGLAHRSHERRGDNLHVMAAAPSVHAAVDWALQLAVAENGDVSRVFLHPAAWEQLQRLVRAPEPAGPRETVPPRGKLAELPDVMQQGSDDLLLIDVEQQLPGPAGANYVAPNFIDPTFRELGLYFVSGSTIDGGPPWVYRAQARAPTAAAAAAAALELATKRNVFQVLLHRTALALARGAVQATAERPRQPSGIALADGGRAAERARNGLRNMLTQLIDQGDARSPGVRHAAADALAAVSNSADDLEKARTEWIRFERITDRYPELEAAAMIIARRGGGREDVARLKRAAHFANAGTGHQYNPLKRRISLSLAKLLEASPALAEKLLEEKNKPFGSTSNEAAFEMHKNETRLNAHYVALARSGDASAREALFAAWDTDRTAWLHEFLARVEPAYLRRIYDARRGGRGLGEFSAMDRRLLPFAVSDHGTIDDLESFLGLLEQDTPIHGDLQTASEPFGAFVRRVGGYGRLRTKLHQWMHALNAVNKGRVFLAIAATGAAGAAEDLAAIERLMAANPENVDAFHEMSQHEAAIAWARIVVREGLFEGFLTRARPAPAGQASLTRIASMLTDVNPILNKAALAAIRLHFGGELDFGI